jgi:hypothetical protein
MAGLIFESYFYPILQSYPQFSWKGNRAKEIMEHPIPD